MEATPQDEGEAAPGMILVADDEELVRKIAVTVLTRAGYNVLAADDGDQACALFEAHADEVDLAFLDVMMPGRNGKAVYDAIVAVRPELPVIFASGYGADALGGDLPEGQVKVIQKPYTPSSLLATIREALGNALAE